MHRRASLLILVVLVVSAASLSAQQEVITAIQVHGNTLTPSDEIVRASGLAVGQPFSQAWLADAETKVKSALRFDSVEIVKRYASISDLSQILVVIQVDEGPVRVEVPDIDAPAPPGGTRPRAVRRSRFNLMFVPILAGQDGYGLAYGLQLAIAGRRNARRRVVVPLSWGGDKRAAIEFQEEFSARLAPRVRTGGSIQRRTHPFFDQHADRKRIWGRTEWSVGRRVQAGTELAWQSSSLADQHEEARSIGADVTVDTRVDPLMPHNAVYVRAAIEGVRFSAPTTSAMRTEIDANGYVGLFAGAVLALRAVREDFSRPAPAFYKSILGGSTNLRGYRAGYAIGDTLAAGSVELRVPLTSPLRMARFGMSVFIDAGTTYDKGQRFRDQKLKRGIGGGLWTTAPLFQLSVMVARGIGETTRVHFSAGLTF